MVKSLYLAPKKYLGWKDGSLLKLGPRLILGISLLLDGRSVIVRLELSKGGEECSYLGKSRWSTLFVLFSFISYINI